jgi:hypothetical protein
MWKDAAAKRASRTSTIATEAQFRFSTHVCRAADVLVVYLNRWNPVTTKATNYQASGSAVHCIVLANPAVWRLLAARVAKSGR